MGPLTSDSAWVRQAFLVDAGDLEAVDQQNRIFSTASLKFTDTTLGGNLCVNPPPQFTRFADIRPANKSRSTKSTGMGRYYSEAIDDHNQIIYLRFGQPAFNKMTTFFGSFYSSDAGQLAKTGRAGGLFYSLGRVVGFVVPLLSWKLLAVHMLGFGLKLASEKPSSKFYYMKPGMPLYWNAVQTIVNQISVNRGIVPRVFGNDDQNALGDGYTFTQTDIDKLHNSFPAMFNSGGGFDIYAMATRAQRLARANEAALKATFADSDDADIATNIQRIYSSTLSDPGTTYQTYLNNWLGSDAANPAGANAANSGSADSQIAAQVAAAGSNAGGATAPTPAAGDSSTEDLSLLQNPASGTSAFAEFLKAEWDDGSAFVSLRVDATGPTQESFSSQFAESELAQKINGMSSSARSTEFNFENGNLVGGVTGDVIGSVLGAVKGFVAGVADSVKLSGLAVLGGAAFVDIPKHWVASAAQLPKASYTIRLVSPYGNPFSQIMNIYAPLAMLLAGALPLSTGKQSYTSPFLCELYDKGRCQIRLGMIDSLTISRGIGNTGWDSEGHALGIEVSFSVMDMSSIMSMPISAGFSFTTAIDTVVSTAAGAAGGSVLGSALGPAGTVVGGVAGAALGAAAGLGVFDDDNAFTDYMSVLGSVDLADNVYPFRRFKRNLTQKMLAFDSWKSPSHMASFAGDLLPSRLISAFYRGSVRGASTPIGGAGFLGG